jgi:hypothetical protein
MHSRNLPQKTEKSQHSPPPISPTSCSLLTHMAITEYSADMGPKIISGGIFSRPSPK